MNENGCFVAADTRTPIRRFVDGLFPGRYLEIPEDLEGYAPSYIRTGVIAVFDWKDRLRLLVSGKICMRIQTKTDVIVTKMVSTSEFSVLPPSYRLPQGE